LLRGAGGAFCSGLDLKAFNAEPPPSWLAEFPALWRGAHKALFQLKATLVVAVERYAINGGAALALAGDFMIIGDDAFVHVGEVQQGMAAPYNLAWLRLRHSEALTARVALLGQRILGTDAVQLGLAYQAVPGTEVLTAAQEFTRALAAYPEGASAHVKAISRAYSEVDADAWFDRAFTVGPAPSQRPRAND
jgi:enoyl-CoA hydratase/carnithine racemase